MSLRCLLFGHDYVVTPEFKDAYGYTRADNVCKRCKHATVAWVGPKVTAPGMEWFDICEDASEAYSEALGESS